MQAAGVRSVIVVDVGRAVEVKTRKQPTSNGTSTRSSKGPEKIVEPSACEVTVWLML